MKKQNFAILVNKINGNTWVCCHASMPEVIKFYELMNVKIILIIKINFK